MKKRIKKRRTMKKIAAQTLCKANETEMDYMIFFSLFSLYIFAFDKNVKRDFMLAHAMMMLYFVFGETKR